MLAAYLMDYALIALALGSMAWSVHHILFQRSPSGWLLAVAILPIAGPCCYFAWNLLDAIRHERRESGRLSGAQARRARERIDALLRERAEGVALPAKTLELGKLSLALGSAEEAERYLSEYATRFPEEAEANYLLGRARAEQAKWREAIVAFQDAASADQKHAQGGALIGLAKAFAASGDAERARLAIEEALKHFALPEAFCLAAGFAEARGEHKAAWHFYDQARQSARAALGSTRRTERRWETIAAKGMRRARARFDEKA